MATGRRLHAVIFEHQKVFLSPTQGAWRCPPGKRPVEALFPPSAPSSTIGGIVWEHHLSSQEQQGGGTAAAGEGLLSGWECWSRLPALGSKEPQEACDSSESLRLQGAESHACQGSKEGEGSRRGQIGSRNTGTWTSEESR